MKTIIENKLTEIEIEHHIKILYSCESGSRAWGFPSPDSDYDVRFIYIRPLDNYISIQPEEDHLSFPINDELDIYGWDITKVLRLMVKSNTTPFEWLQSHIIYREDIEFKNTLWLLCQNYFCARSNINHYLGIAHGAMDTITDDKIKIKKLFYVLRPLLAAMWCAKHNEIAPMNIEPLLTLFDDNLREKVLSIIKLKSGVDEYYKISIDSEIRTWIDYTFSYCKEISNSQEKNKFDIAPANLYFKKLIFE